jgi:hypothetical protein
MTVMPMPSQEPSQLAFEGEGWPKPEGVRFTLLGTRDLPTDRGGFAFHEYVTGRFKGHITGRRHRERGDGTVLVYEITVLEAELDR